jgi:hypothetical protein
MKIISEEFSTGEQEMYEGKRSYVQYKTEIDIGDENPWCDVSRRFFGLDSQEFKNAVSAPEEFILTSRKITKAIFFRYIGQKLYPDIWKPPT